MYKHLRTFTITMGTILRARSYKHIFSQLVDFPYNCYLFYRDLDLAWPYLSFLHALRATSCRLLGWGLVFDLDRIKFTVRHLLEMRNFYMNGFIMFV